MDLRYWLGIALGAATLVAACGGADTSSLGPRTNSGGDDDDTTSSSSSSSGATPKPSTPDTNTPTNSPDGKSFYIQTVHPFLESSCGACHDSAGPGPNWLTKGKPDQTYTQLFSLGFVTDTSVILTKGTHGNSTTNVLSEDQKTKFKTWVSMELKDGGKQATPNVLEKLATCIDSVKFKAMNLQQLRTTRRNNENANQCTGCNQAACTNCHASDDATGFLLATGKKVLEASDPDYTFNHTKITNPAFLQKYFGVSPTGEPVASNAIQNKSDATVKDQPYTHPMFTLNANTKAAIDAFVNDAITKYKANACTGTAAPAP